jgi:AraC family transcriptional regulator of adaptative response / methylphosphotriester-DNA alkyltransferase methyltransferase
MQREMTIQYRRRLYEQAVAVIAREYATDLSVDDVAQRLFCSRRQLQRVFGDAGTSFRTVCRKARMAAARNLLRAHPEMTVRGVAQAVGYQQPSQFAKAFRREVGTSPAEFRAVASRLGGPGVLKPSYSPAHLARSQPPAPSLERLLGLERTTSPLRA